MLHWIQQLAPVGIFTTDADLCIETWNSWLEAHSRLSAADVCGKPLLEVFPELASRQLDDPYRRALEGQVSVLSTSLHRYLLPLPVTTRNSVFQHMQQTARIGPLLLDQTVCGTITTIEDVTQREMHTAALAEQAAELENRVKERTARLDDTVAQLESFSYTVAHDLRAPIRTFKGYTEILLESYADELPDKAREYLKRMIRAADGMNLLTRDLLQFNQLSRQHISADPIDLTELIHEIVTHNAGLQRPGLLHVQQPLFRVIGNRTMLQQCLSNLLDNALKFNLSGQTARITVRAELQPAAASSATPTSSLLPFQEPNPSNPLTGEIQERTGHELVRIYVEDNGIGIAAEHHRQIFGVFERIQGALKFEGTGIGLAIVARAVQRMNGRCGVDSVPGEGSSFWIELPAAISPRLAQQS